MQRASILLAMFAGACQSSPANNSAGEDVSEFMNRLPPVSETTWQSVGTLECRPTVADVCGANGCQRNEPAGGWTRWTPATRTYERCDRNGCDRYEARVDYAGSFATITLPGRATFARLTGRNAFMEVVTQMDGVLIYRGQCEPVAE